MIDPARPEVLDAVARCNTAGIRPVMITGDHKTTALAIAREIGIYKDGDIAITGSELEKLSDAELNEERLKVFRYMPGWLPSIRCASSRHGRATTRWWP